MYFGRTIFHKIMIHSNLATQSSTMTVCLILEKTRKIKKPFQFVPRLRQHSPLCFNCVQGCCYIVKHFAFVSSLKELFVKEVIYIRPLATTLDDTKNKTYDSSAKLSDARHSSSGLKYIYLHLHPCSCKEEH